MSTLESQRENFRGANGEPYLVRCPECDKENWAPAVASGQCAWCGWREQQQAVVSAVREGE